VLGVVTGLKSEAKLLRGLDFMCISTGGRAHIARAKIERLLDRGMHGLISFGIAGALSPELRTGDIVIADKVVSESGESWPAHQPWIEALLSSAPQPPSNSRVDDVPHHAAARRSEGHVNVGPLWTAGSDDWDKEVRARTRGVLPGKAGAILGLDRMLSSPQDKADAFARAGTLAIDMESHHVARAAAERGLPFIAIRAIADQAHEALPAIMAGFVDMEGRTKMSAVLAALILGRVSVRELLQAGGASRRAHQALLRCRGALAGLG
jgi:adenosylhomocysteine nucleosidase